MKESASLIRDIRAARRRLSSKTRAALEVAVAAYLSGDHCPRSPSRGVTQIRVLLS